MAYGEQPDVEVSLRSDAAEYYVGQGVSLELSVTNRAPTPVHGFFRLDASRASGLPTGTLSYCDRAGCHDYVLRTPNEDIVKYSTATSELALGEEVRSYLTIAWDEPAARFVLREPGEQELRWTSDGIFDGHKRNWDGVSRGPRVVASVRIKVLPVPSADRDAFDEYRSAGLARIAEYSYRSAVDDREFAALLAFLRRFPSSRYADTLRHGAASLLAERLRIGRVAEQDVAFVRDYVARRGAP